MSTMLEIQNLVKEGKLFPYKVESDEQDFEICRNLYVTKEFLDMCPPSDEQLTKASIRGQTLHDAQEFLADFIGGEEIEYGLHIKSLKPHKKNVWELRLVPKSTSTGKHIRMFGWIPKFNIFIITHMEARNDLGSSHEKWDKAVDKCVKKRNKHFKNLPIMDAGLDITRYFSNSINEWS